MKSNLVYSTDKQKITEIKRFKKKRKNIRKHIKSKYTYKTVYKD